MRVLVTGAAGRIGSEVCRALAGDGHDVVATDARSRDDLPVKVHVADLLDRHAVSKVAVKLDACVHLGNHIDFVPPDPQLIFGENMTININVFQAAVDGGAKKLVFASSFQAVQSVPRLEGQKDELPRYLPIDGDMPPHPTNPYALSKVCGEEMLRYYSRVFGTQSIAVRFPGTFPAAQIPTEFSNWRERWPWVVRQAGAYLSTADAGGLVASIMRTDLPGFRVYQPGSKYNFVRRPAREMIEQHFAGVPLKKPVEAFEPGGGLIDLSKITRETGWSPKD